MTPGTTLARVGLLALASVQGYAAVLSLSPNAQSWTPAQTILDLIVWTTLGVGAVTWVFEREHGRKGRLSIQTNPKFFRDANRITEQALHFGSLTPNLLVKIPATKAGIQAVAPEGGRPKHQSVLGKW